MKASLGIWFYVISIWAFLAGCDSNPSSKRVTLRLVGERSANVVAMLALEKEYEQQHLCIDLDIKASSFEDACNKANQDFAYHTGLYDLILQYNFSLSSFVTNDYVLKPAGLRQQLPDSLMAFEKLLYPQAWREVGFWARPGESPEMVGYPFAANSMLLAYNRLLFEDERNKAAYRQRYGADLTPPTTWEQFRNIADFFTRPEEQTYGVCLQGATGGWLYYEFVNVLFSMGGKVMDKQFGWQGDPSTPILLDAPEAIEAARFYVGLKPFTAGNFTTVDMYEELRLLRTGKVAMGLIWSDIAFPLVDDGNGGFDPRFGFVPIPGKVSALAGGAYFINKDSRHPAEAFAHVVDQLQTPAQIALAKKGLCSANRAVYEDPEVKAIPYSEALRQSLERGVYMLEAGPDASLISDKITTFLQMIWKGEIPLEEGMHRMQQEITAERKDRFRTLYPPTPHE